MNLKNLLILTETQINTAKLTALFDEKAIKYEVKALQNSENTVESCVTAAFDAMVYFGRNAENVEKAFATAKNANYQKAVLISSALSYFDRTLPEKQLAEKHAFIKNSNKCESAALENGGEMVVSVLETPFLEGCFPADFPTYDGVIGFDCKKLALAPMGGCAQLSIDDAARATLAVLLNGENGVIYPVSDKNLKYKDILKTKMPENKQVYEFPEEFYPFVVLNKKLKYKKQNVVAEFDLKSLYSELLQENLYFNAEEVKKALKYEELFE